MTNQPRTTHQLRTSGYVLGTALAASTVTGVCPTCGVDRYRSEYHRCRCEDRSVRQASMTTSADGSTEVSVPLEQRVREPKGPPRQEPVRVVPPNMTRGEYRAAIRHLRKLQKKASKT